MNASQHFRPTYAAAREAFRRAAEAELACVPCAGEGAWYRALVPIWREFFDPPSDDRASWDISSGVSVRPSKLRAGPPVADGRDFRYTRSLRLAR